MSIFNSLNVARSGLFASQKAIELAGHNIANVNTEGYSRQRLEVSSSPSVDLIGSSSGGGVDLDEIRQLRDQYLDIQYRQENSLSNELLFKADGLSYIEGIIAEPSPHGINAAMGDLFNSLEELSYNAEDLSLREIVVQNGVKLTDTFRSISTGLVDYQKDLDKNLTMMVDEINSIAEQITNYNQTIKNYENQGRQANDLRDKRNLLVDKLSEFIPVEAKEDNNKRFSVKIAGVYLVEQYQHNKLEVSDKTNPVSQQKTNSIYWQDSDKELGVKSGKLKALIDMRDGNSPDNQGVAYFIEEIDNLARDIARVYNNIHQKGYPIPSDAEAKSKKGINFFKIPKDGVKDDYEKLNARNIKISDALLDSAYNIAASDEEIDGDLNWGNSDNLKKLVDLREQGIIILENKNESGNVEKERIINFEENLRGIVSDLAISANYYNSRAESQSNLREHIYSQKMSISEVSIDEEMMNLVQYQHSYSAAAKLVNVVDEMLMTLINMK